MNFNGVTEVVFVCSGNIIRSAFCDIYARHLGCRYEVSSLGTTYRNSSIHHSSRRALLERGVDVSLIDKFVPTYISDFSFHKGQIFFVMTEEHREILESFTSSIHLVTELIGENSEIEDPYFYGGYDGVFDKLERCVKSLVTQGHVV